MMFFLLALFLANLGKNQIKLHINLIALLEAMAIETAHCLADLLGESEDFDGIVSALEDL